MEPKPTVHQATFALLRSLRMTTVFGNPGSTELGWLRDWPSDFRYILGLNEASVVAMADGYAQASRRPAIASLHSAGGLGHAMTSVMTAWWNQSPVVILAGQQSRALLPLMPYLHDLEATEFPRPYAKWSAEPARAADVPGAVARACYTAMQKPSGPTFVSVPADDWDAPADAVDAREVATEFAPDPTAIGRVAAALEASRRPAMVVGPAIDRDGGWDLAVELACRTRAAVWASPYSGRCSFPEDHPLFAGFLPAAPAPLCRKLEAHDVIVVLGAPVFTYHIRSEGPVIPPGARLFQLTDDPGAAAWAPAGSSVLCTMRLGLEGLLERLAPSARPAPGPLRRPAAPVASHPIAPAFVLHAISEAMAREAMAREAIIVDEVPSHRPLLHDYLPIRASGGFYAGASGALGWGLPAAVGIALAQPGRRIICLLGDGSAQYSIQGLWTAAQHRLPITFVIFNNGGYAALDAFSSIIGADSHPSFQLPGIDIVAIAAGYGCASRRVERAEELGPALAGSFGERGPTLLDVPIVDTPASLF